MVTAFDGYPLACKGQAGKALAIAAYASFAGGTLSRHHADGGSALPGQGLPPFQSADYFALMVLGLSAVAAFAGKGRGCSRR